MSYAAELDGLRRFTVALIASEGRPVALVRPADGVKTPEGGWKRPEGSGTSLAATRRWFQQVRGDARRILTDQGEQIVQDAVLVGRWTDDFREEDTFLANEKTYRVVWVHPDRRYEVRAACVLVD